MSKNIRHQRSDLVQWQFSNNQITRYDDRVYASHRARLMQFVESIFPVGPDRSAAANWHRAAILGAGNCNDLNLAWFAQRFQQTHLIDLDANAIRHGIQTQCSESDSRFSVHAPFDIASPLLSGRVDRSIEKGSGIAVDGCDFVLSSNVLSQLLFTVDQLARQGRISVEHLDAIRWVRRGHLNNLAAMLAPQGVGVLAVDFVSSDTLPELLDDRADLADTSYLAELTRSAIAKRNFFSGLNPLAIIEEIKQLSTIRFVRCSTPWIWQMGPRRYLVTAIQFCRHAG